jgi:hypothetical protein
MFIPLNPIAQSSERRQVRASLVAFNWNICLQKQNVAVPTRGRDVRKVAAPAVEFIFPPAMAG